MVSDQLSIEDAIAAGEEGQARAVKGADPEFITQVMARINFICRTHLEFSADDIWFEGLQTKDNRALGPLLKRAQKNGWCEPTGEFTRSAQKSCHGMPRRIWRSKIYANKG